MLYIRDTILYSGRPFTEHIFDPEYNIHYNFGKKLREKTITSGPRISVKCPEYECPEH